MTKKSKQDIVPVAPKKIVRKLREDLPIAKPLGEIFGSMIPLEEETPEHILAGLINPENIGMKSRIPNPLVLTQFEILGHYAEIDNLPQTAKVFEKFAEFFRVNGISADGERVKEIVQALSERIKQERTATEKLTAPPE
jgi:hypothetical protein